MHLCMFDSVTRTGMLLCHESSGLLEDCLTTSTRLPDGIRAGTAVLL